MLGQRDCRGVRWFVAALLVLSVLPALAQTDTSSWTSNRITTPADRAGGAKLMKTAPVAPAGKLILPPAGSGGVVVTRAPSADVPTLPSVVPAGDTTVAKNGTGADPAYEAFDQARYLTALELAKAADARGEPQASTLIGRIYQEGLGVPRDEVVAAQWYRRGTELGDINAMFAFAVLLAEGGPLKKDRAGAALLFEKAAAKGHVTANYNLALLFLTGDGKPQNPQRAYAHLQYAAEAGLPNAQYDLATLYATGTGVGANAFEAAKWFQKAADAGLPEAQLDFGVLLFTGHGPAQNKASAVEMFRLAAEKGNPVAQNRLALCLANGEGIAANPIEAVMWHLIAKSAGANDPGLEKVAAKLSKADRLKAERAAAEWRERVQVLMP